LVSRESSVFRVFGVVGVVRELELVSTEEEGNLSSPVTKVAAVMMAAELL
jgi:hypothetical protein